MTYALSEALQVAIYEQLATDPALVALVGEAIHDAVPPAPLAEAPQTCVVIGEERVRDGSTQTSMGAIHDFTVTVHSTVQGFRTAKAVAAAVGHALTDGALVLSRGAVVYLRFVSARADRGSASEPRRIVLRFRAFAEDDG